MKKLMMLGGAINQVPLIRAAKSEGYYIVLCDYTTTNPGIPLVDKHYQVSTLDFDAVLEVAKKEKIDGIISNSEPAMVNVALVAEQLGLPGNPSQSVKALSNKIQFRRFLHSNGFYAPYSEGYEDFQSMGNSTSKFRFPVIVKPVDSSGSRGVNKVDDPKDYEFAFKDAMKYSRCGQVIVEEFIEKKGYQISGDCFVIDGKLVFGCFGNEYYGKDGVKEYVPLGECWPSVLPSVILDRVQQELQRLISCLSMKFGAFNVEAILDRNDNIYILEMNPRNGGSLIPQIIQYATGVDTIKYTVKAAMGEDCSDLYMVEPEGFWCNYMVHSKAAGELVNVTIAPELEGNFVEYQTNYHEGDSVCAFSNAGDALGTMIFRFDDKQEMFSKIDNFSNLIQVDVINNNI